MTPEIEAKLRKAFADRLVLEFDPKQDFEELITPTAQVLADSKHPIGIITMGTFQQLRGRSEIAQIARQSN